jgi:hypothetical protein
MLLGYGNVPFFMGLEGSDELIPFVLQLPTCPVAFGPSRQRDYEVEVENAAFNCSPSEYSRQRRLAARPT